MSSRVPTHLVMWTPGVHGGKGAKMDILADKGQNMEAEKFCSLGQMGMDPPTAQVTSEGTIHAPKVNFGDICLGKGYLCNPVTE